MTDRLSRGEGGLEKLKSLENRHLSLPPLRSVDDGPHSCSPMIIMFS